MPLLNGKVVDLTGPGLTERWGVTCTDLGASVVAPNGKLVSVFGDTFSGHKVGEGDWRSPVVLIGTGDADHEIVYERAGGDDPDYARQLWHYVHDTSSGWIRGGISTVIPSDLLRVGDSIYLHAIVNRGFGNVIWTEIWRSDDSGISWTHMGPDAKFPAALHGGYAQCWSWDHDPDDGWVYVVATGFQRDKGIILMRVRPENIGQRSRYVSWGFANQTLGMGPDGHADHTRRGRSGASSPFAAWRKASGSLADSSHRNMRSGYRVVDSPVANMHTTPIQIPVAGSAWQAENHLENQVAQLYGGYVLPGSRFDIEGGVGLMVSQWNTADGWPYRAMQFKAALKDSTKTVPPPDPINL